MLREQYIRNAFESHNNKATIDKAKELEEKDSSDAAVGASVGSQSGPVSFLNVHIRLHFTILLSPWLRLYTLSLTLPLKTEMQPTSSKGHNGLTQIEHCSHHLSNVLEHN